MTLPIDTRRFDQPTHAPGWIKAARGGTAEEQAFMAGAALAHLVMSVAHAQTPQALLRDRLALRAAEASLSHMGRSESVAQLRDEVHLLRPGDHPGPGGEIYQRWRQAVARPLAVGVLRPAAPDLKAETIQAALRGGGLPIARAAAALETILQAHPKAEVSALIVADAVLSKSLGFSCATPVLGPKLTARDLRLTGADLRVACGRAIVASVSEATALAMDLSRRAERLRGVAPKLRTKRASEAVELFLTRDAVSPMALTRLMSDRAARRFCDRLVELGAARELTGRSAFRLYGL